MVKYTVYTEDLGNLGKLVSTMFESFTLSPQIGFYGGKQEKSISIVIISQGIEDKIQQLATLIKLENKQSEVLVTKQEVTLI